MQREPAEIEREIEVTRVYLSDTVDAIAGKVSPKAVAGRTLDGLKEKVHQVTERGTDTFTTRDGSGVEGTYEIKRKLRVGRVAAVAAAVVGAVVGAALLRRR